MKPFAAWRVRGFVPQPAGLNRSFQGAAREHVMSVAGSGLASVPARFSVVSFGGRSPAGRPPSQMSAWWDGEPVSVGISVIHPATNRLVDLPRFTQRSGEAELSDRFV
jgi:hypothetical protein